MKRDVRIQRRYPHPPEAVWRWLADRNAMAQWLMPNTFEPRVGHEFEFRTKPAPGFDGIVRCKVLAFDPPHRLAFTWVGGGLDTVVTFELEPVGAETILRLSHSGFSGAEGFILSFMLGNGWNGMLSRALPQQIARAESGGPSGRGGGEKTPFWRVFDRVFSR
jgi:uncharacterized protein YndB with AHSA1/START domain